MCPWEWGAKPTKSVNQKIVDIKELSSFGKTKKRDSFTEQNGSQGGEWKEEWAKGKE